MRRPGFCLRTWSSLVLGGLVGGGDGRHVRGGATHQHVRTSISKATKPLKTCQIWGLGING